MKNLFPAVILLCFCLKLSAQLPEAYLKPKQVKELGTFSKSAPLVVVIENEKNTDDAALISALKSFWNVGPVKYMSALEFTEKFKSNSLEKTNLYLYNNYSYDVRIPGRVVVMISPTKVTEMPALYSGYYLTNDPYALIKAKKTKHAPPFLHFSADALYDKKHNPSKGFYSLMVKNFNHDIHFCQDENSYNPKKKKKNKRKNGIYFFSSEPIGDRSLLLVKEQVASQVKNNPKEKGRKAEPEKKQKFVTDKYSEDKKPIVVFPEDIDYAVKKNDKDILLYNGGCLYSAQDGSVYATIRGNSSGPGWYALYLGISLSVTAASLFLFFS